MFNYHDLDDYEFEVLCRDIMERKLGIELRHFGKGVDGGIDLLDKEKEPNVIVQVKHYINSTFSSLRTTLKREVEKVKKLKPKSYYVCCSCNQTITSNNIDEIYNLFSDYMESKANIMTLQDIDDFLAEEINEDIVRKNFKLWLSASNILSEMNNRDKFIDCEVLLSDINDEYKYYVQTNLYERCKEIIDKFRVVMIVGSPGVGKTTISKMLILYFASQGYNVRYTTNGSISGIKQTLSLSKENKEVILLDDCLGQCYFNIKETQEEELISLIKYIKCNPKKILILNSRVTIFNQARKNSQNFDDLIINDKIKIHVIDMDRTNISEKAKIFFNHIYFNEVPREYYEEIKKDKKYRLIINHSHYNPRIIQYVTQKRRYADILPEDYPMFILSSLDNSKDVWENEFRRRIKTEDRLLLLVLFSLTENTVSYDILKECYNNRLILNSDVDTSIDNFEAVISRLNKSMIKVIDMNGEKVISVLNPSINDYIGSIFFENRAELYKIRKSIVYYEQIGRCYENKEESDKEIIKRISDGTMMRLKIQNLSEYGNIDNLILYKICENSILDNKYKKVVHSYINSLEDSSDNEKLKQKKSYILQRLNGEPLNSFYDIDNYIYKNKLLKLYYIFFDSKNALKETKKMYYKAKQEKNDEMIKDLKLIAIDSICKNIDNYLENFDVGDFLGEFDIDDYIIQNEEVGFDITGDCISVNGGPDINVNELECVAKEEFVDDINGFFTDLGLPEIEEEIKKYINEIDIGDYISESDMDNYLESVFEPNYDDGFDDDIYYDEDSNDSYSEIDAIFEGHN